MLFLVGTPSSHADPRGSGLPSEIARVFPQGLPPGATAYDSDTVAFAEGTALLDVVPGAPTNGACSSGQVCLWEDANYEGQRVVLTQCDIDGDGNCDWSNLSPYLFNDKMSSWKNRRTADAKWAWDSNGGGTLRCMNAGSQNPDLPDNIFGTGDNDEASSLKIFKTSTQC
jgi:hypothetical protein